MLTPDVFHQVAHTRGEARDQAFAVVAAAAGDPAAYAVAVETLARTTDFQVAFWCLDALIKQFPALMAPDAPRLVPVLLRQLVDHDFTVADRAVWALSVAGPAAVPALCQAIAHAQSTDHRVRYVHALGKNTNVYTQAAPVLALLAGLLDDAEPPVRHWAMVALMDMSPLRPWFDTRLNPRDFDPLYPGLMRVAEEGVQASQDEIAARYRDLITRYWEQKNHPPAND